MRIGIVCYPTFGGSGVLATELGRGLAARGHQIHFITYRQPVRLINFAENVYYHEVPTSEYPLFEYAPYDTAMASTLVDVATSARLDLLHVHYAIPHAAIAYMAREILRAKGIYIPVITTLHGTDITLVGKNRSFAPVVEFSINQSDGVTAVSESLKQETLETFQINKEIEVIYNFVDFSRFTKTDKEHFRRAIAPDGEKILVHTSNFRPVKHVDDVIRIFQRINEQIPAKLLLIGDGPERQNMEMLCRDLDLCDEIRFLGKLEAVEEVLAIADLFLLPSGHESFGLAALEAMACEVPVISSNAGGLPEVNIHGVTGYLEKPGDVEAMAEDALSILVDPEKQKLFRRNAYEQALRFSIDTILPQYEAYYEQIRTAALIG
ncbi:MAG: N-acetyl-alpha-D-glucosaminyl L-malate synthase BshA [Saprospiraceae bacterium]|nr:N-acetyl-alpha-D-glucosaminyl L-malate synthase BshA [Saprospiraceae bacterium]